MPLFHSARMIAVCHQSGDSNPDPYAYIVGSLLIELSSHSSTEDSLRTLGENSERGKMKRVATITDTDENTF